MPAPTGVFLVGDWPEARRILATAAPRLRRAIDQSVLQEAQLMRAKIIEGLTTQAPGGHAFRPLSPGTLAMRRFRRFAGTKALLVRGDLKNSITIRRETGGVFVGINRTARGRRGAPLANIAELNEFGSRPIVIHVTPAMRRLLAAALGASGEGRSHSGSGPAGAGTGIIVVQIPARPFIRPVADRYFGNADEVRTRFFRRVALSLHGDLGVV